MKKSILTAILLFAGLQILFAQKLTRRSLVLFEKNFAPNSTTWKNVSDTVRKEILFGVDKRKVLLGIKYVVGTEKEGCLKISYCKVTGTLVDNENITLKISNNSSIPCASKWNSTDKRRFNQLILLGNYHTRLGIKSVDYSGKILQVAGNDEISYYILNKSTPPTLVKL